MMKRVSIDQKSSAVASVGDEISGRESNPQNELHMMIGYFDEQLSWYLDTNKQFYQTIIPLKAISVIALH